MSASMTPREEWHLDTRRLGRRALVYDCVDSTNTLAAALADDPTNAGVVVLADEQLAGRGQHGRTWQCPPGDGVLLSVLLFPPPALRRPAILTAWAAVAVCETIRASTSLQARIKWPNDVLIHGRKVCGILIEQGRAVVAGIGLNVNQNAESLAAVGLPQAGSLALFRGSPLDRQEVARMLIEHLDREYDSLCQGDLAGLEACWKWRIGLLGKQVVVEGLDQVHRGRLRDLGWDGVELELAGGKTLRLAPETVRHVEPA
jgi:BirA family biotin operon repressor/biotin-[acetyl-CoA-carboxylase] ligase